MGFAMASAAGVMGNGQASRVGVSDQDPSDGGHGNNSQDDSVVCSLSIGTFQVRLPWFLQENQEHAQPGQNDSR